VLIGILNIFWRYIHDLSGRYKKKRQANDDENVLSEYEL
jgi:hypothetical protein